jgi:excisionase family DNA binding protein
MANDRNFIPTYGWRSGTPETGPGDGAEMFTAKELQQLLKISAKTIYGYVQRGLIPYVRIQSNVRFPKRQILEWIERQTYQPRSLNGSGPRRP